MFNGLGHHVVSNVDYGRATERKVINSRYAVRFGGNGQATLVGEVVKSDHTCSGLHTCGGLHTSDDGVVCFEVMVLLQGYSLHLGGVVEAGGFWGVDQFLAQNVDSAGAGFQGQNPGLCVFSLKQKKEGKGIIIQSIYIINNFVNN